MPIPISIITSQICQSALVQDGCQLALSFCDRIGIHTHRQCTWCQCEGYHGFAGPLTIQYHKEGNRWWDWNTPKKHSCNIQWTHLTRDEHTEALLLSTLPTSQDTAAIPLANNIYTNCLHSQSYLPYNPYMLPSCGQTSSMIPSWRWA